MDTFDLKELKHDDKPPFSDIPLTQMPFYGSWQSANNRKVRRFVVTKNTLPIIYFQLIFYPLFGKMKYAHTPYGPVTEKNEISIEGLLFLKKEIRCILKEEGAIFCRLDFNPVLDPKILSTIFKASPQFTYKGAYFQPRVEWALDITQSEQELLARMHQKTRYSINLAKRKDLKVEIIEEGIMERFNDFYNLMKETGERDRFHLHSKEYYENVFKISLKEKNAALVIVSFEGEVLVANLIIFYGDKAMYLYGSSSNHYRNLMPTYLAQWSAILYSKKRGAVEYNFGGIHTERFPNNAWKGITYFKKNFGGYEIIHSPFYDIVQKPFWYMIYSLRKMFK